MIRHQLGTRSQSELDRSPFLGTIFEGFAVSEILNSPQLVALGDALYSYSVEIARMRRFTKNNGITEGLHAKMEVLCRQGYGFRNFNNYRLRVRIMCS